MEGEPVGRLRVAASGDAVGWTRGVHHIGVGSREPTILVVPELDPDRPLGLCVFFHGAGADGRQSVDLVHAVAAVHHVAILAPTARAQTWDLLMGGLGPDAEAVDRALGQTLAGLDVASERIAVGGFSDGASYALALGLANGDRIRSILAYSPGFAAPPFEHGRPSVFVSHGTADQVLPIDRTSRRLVPALRTRGYEVTYREFDGGHGVPPAIAEEGFAILPSIGAA